MHSDSHRTNNDASLAISVIVPMRNEAHRIKYCLDSILSNDYPLQDLEILVADGISTDGSRDIVAEYAAQFACIRMLDNPGRIVSTGLNICIRQARGEVILILGAHSQLPEHYISKCLRELQRSNADVVGGILITQPGAETVTARAIALMAQHPFGVGWSGFRTGSGGKDVDTVPYGAYRRFVFGRIGLFNEQLVRNQDFELNARVRNAGHRLHLSSDLQVTYHNVPTLRRLAVQAFHNGFWLPTMWYLSPASFRLRHAIPSAFLLSLVFGLFLASLSSATAIPLAVTSFLYAAGVLLSALHIAFRADWRIFFPVMIAIVTQHVMYGTGTLIGTSRVLQLTSNPERCRLPKIESS